MEINQNKSPKAKIIEDINTIKDIYKKILKVNEKGICFNNLKSIGVKTIISNFRKSDTLGYRKTINETDYEIIYNTEKLPTITNNIGTFHDLFLMGMNITYILQTKNYSSIIAKEFPVGDKSLLVQESPLKQDKYSNITGSIDEIYLYNKQNIVLCEVKTSTTEAEYTMEYLFLKQDYIRQLEIYATILETMFENNKMNYKVDHFIVVAIHIHSKHTRLSIWKLNRNKNKWLDVNNETEKDLFSIKFKKIN